MNKLSVDFDKTLFGAPAVWPEVGKQKLIHKLVAAYVRRKKKQYFIFENLFTQHLKDEWL